MDRIDIAAAAKLIRSDIAAAIKAGRLPAIKASVRISRYSMGQSLVVHVESLPDDLYALNQSRVKWESEHPHNFILNAPEHAQHRYSSQGQLLLAKLEQIIDRHNDIIGIDSNSREISRNFHVSLSFDGALTTAERKRFLALAA